MVKGWTFTTEPEDIKTWYELLTLTMDQDGEKFEDMVCTLSEAELRVPFDAGHTATMGKNFTAWGKNWVYFPLDYDNMQWVGHAPRNPCDIAIKHQDESNWVGSC